MNAGRHALPEQDGAGHQQHEHREPEPRPPEHPADAVGVAVGHPGEPPVERAEEPGRVRLVRLAEQQRAERRRERQRHDAREHHRDHQRHRELLEHLAGHAAQERHRHEDGAQHEHDGDQRAGHLPDGAVGRHPRRRVPRWP